MSGRLITKLELLILYPALKGRGKNPKWRVDWMVRTGMIPIVKLGPRSIYFNEDAIDEWIKAKTISARDFNRVRPKVIENDIGRTKKG